MPTEPPKHSDKILLSYPSEHVLLLTFNRPEVLNVLGPDENAELEKILDWFEREPSLWVLVLTGSGRLFTAGADLKGWKTRAFSGDASSSGAGSLKSHGFGALSRRETAKPIIAAVNGGTYGGGMEIIVNCDLVVASEDAKFAYAEVKRGVVANQGGIPRLVRTAGHQLASEMLLLGKTISAYDAHWSVNVLVPTDKVVETALSLAKDIIANSPDAVQSTKRALLLAQNHGNRDTFTEHLKTKESLRVYSGENIKEGLTAFVEKRPPQWKSPAKL